MKLSPRTTTTFTLGLLTVGLLTGCGGPVTETATTSGALNPCPNNQQTLTIAALEPKPGTGQGTLGNIAALQLAVKDINNAGGTLNTETKYAIGYHDPNPTLATIHTTKDLINVGTPVIIGPTTSELTLAILDITTSANTALLSVSATAPQLENYPTNNLFYRLIEPDTNIAEALATGTGGKQTLIIAREDTYGTALANATKKALTQQGAPTPTTLLYNTATTNFTPAIQQLATKPSAVIIIGFDETKQILDTLEAAQITPKTTQILLTQDNGHLTAYNTYPTGHLTGTLIATNTTNTDTENQNTPFLNNLRETHPNSAPDINPRTAAVTYDAAITIALATEQAGCTNGPQVAAQIINVTSEPGEPCTTYQQCKTLITAGKQINYQGISGPLDLTPNRQPDPGPATLQPY